MTAPATPGAIARGAAAVVARPEWLVFIVAAITYAVLAAPGVAWMDAGELTAAGYTLGGAHPPGHPLHTLVAKAATLVPLGEIGFRVNLASALAMAAALAGVVAVARALVAGSGPALAAGVAAALLAGLSPAALINATRAEVYAPTAALVVWCVALSLRVGKDGQPRAVLGAALLAALAAALHPLTAAAVALPCAGLVAVRLGRRSLRLAPLVVGLGVVALALYAYLPLRATAADPPLLMWGEPASAAGLRDVILGAAYQSNFAPAGAAERAGAALAILLEGPGLGLVLVGVAGLGFAALTGLRGAAALVGVVAVVVVEVALQRTFNPDLRGYLLPALLIAAVGLAPLVEAAQRMTRGLITTARGRAALTAAVLVPVVLAAALSPAGPALDRDDAPTRLHALTVGRMPPGPAVYFANSDHALFAAQYERLVAGARPDVAVANAQLCRDRWFLVMVKRALPELYVPYLDDGVRGQPAERLAVVNLRRGNPVGSDEPAFGRLLASHAEARGAAYRFALAPSDAAADSPASAPLDFRGDVGARVAHAIGLTRARYEAARGRLGAAAVAAGIAERFGDALATARTDPARPSLLEYLPGRSFALIYEPWQAELAADDLGWQAGLALAAPDDGAMAERRIHAAWRALLERGAAGLAETSAALVELGPDAEAATSRMLLAIAPALAEPWLAGYVVRHPDDAGGLALTASLASNRGDLAAAEAGFRRAIQLDPTDAESWARLGIALARLGRRPEAEAAWRRALELEPDRADVKAWLATP